jgi:L,D-transpeptidase YbiS
LGIRLPSREFLGGAALFGTGIAAGLVILMALLVGAGYFVARRDAAVSVLVESPPPKAPSKSALERRNRTLLGRLDSLGPRGMYIVIDTARNTMTLMKNGRTLRSAVVSSGSGNMLDDPSGERQWVFDTPRGEFHVIGKVENPDWIKPDWAFIEEGESPPGKWSDRVEPGMLGEYALAFGNGYFIHGTLYTRLLGRNVTHGCIRVADKDLEYIYKIAPVGTRIYIY